MFSTSSLEFLHPKTTLRCVFFTEYLHSCCKISSALIPAEPPLHYFPIFKNDKTYCMPLKEEASAISPYQDIAEDSSIYNFVSFWQT